MTETPDHSESNAEIMASRTVRPKYSGEPTHAQIMRRPKWILALFLVLGVAIVFASLAQWQLSNAVRLDDDSLVETEVAVPITEVDSAGKAVNDVDAGRLVRVLGRFTPNDFQIVENRANSGKIGFWLVGHLVSAENPGALEESGTAFAMDDPANYAVALGWSQSRAEVEKALQKARKNTDLLGRNTFVARFMPTEGTEIPHPNDDQTRLVSLVPGQLANLWQPPLKGWASAAFLVAHTDALILQQLSLGQIDSFAPSPPEKINWLSLFYALEWVIFAGFAVYFWVRLTRDAWEREHELKLQAAEQELARS